MFNNGKIEALAARIEFLEKKLSRTIDWYFELANENQLLKDYLKVQVQDSITIKKIVKKK